MQVVLRVSFGKVGQQEGIRRFGGFLRSSSPLRNVRVGKKHCNYRVIVVDPNKQVKDQRQTERTTERRGVVFTLLHWITVNTLRRFSNNISLKYKIIKMFVIKS